MNSRSLFPTACALAGLLLSTHAAADTLSAIGGLTFGRNLDRDKLPAPAALLGLEYTLGVSNWIKLGGFYDYEQFRFDDHSLGKMRFRGLVLRLHVRDEKLSGPFTFVKLGLAEQMFNDDQEEEHTRNRLAYGAGLGYQFVLTDFLSVSPRLGVRFLPDSLQDGSRSSAVYDTSLMFSVHF